MERYLGARKEARQNRPIALILLDVNDFKHINDYFGHEAGDAALIYASDILREIFNRTDAFLTRYGGDEFVIVMSENHEEVIEDILAAAAAASAAVVLACSVGAYAYTVPCSYVSLDVNPSLEFSLNRFDRVLSVSGVSKDGLYWEDVISR